MAYPGVPYPGQVYPSQVPEEYAPSSGTADGNYAASYRFEVLDREESFVMSGDFVQPKGELKWFSTKSIKGGGTISVLDTGEHIDWPNARIKPYRQHHYDDGTIIEYPLGIYLTSAPTEKWTEDGRSWDVELLDKNSILDGDIVTDEDGAPVTFSVVAGDNVIDVVKSLIQSTGEDTPAISADPVPLNNDMSWEVGTTLLKIINELLNASNHFSLMCDMEGQYRIIPYTPPKDRPVIYRDGTEFGWETPFSYGESSLMSPTWSRDMDVFAVPNRWVSMTQGDSDNEALVATATNEDPDSPFSYQNRGRWITQVETGVEAVDEAALQAHADRKLASATSVTMAVSAEHLFLPELQINSVVQFLNEKADNMDIPLSVLNTTVPFDPMALCKTEFREFTGFEQVGDELDEEME